MPGTPFRRLLVGIAPTSISDDAAHAGARLARILGAELDLVHAVPVPPVMWIGVTRDELTRMHADAVSASCALARGRLRALEQRLELEPDELGGHLECLAGDPDRALIERARETGADVVILGPHQERRRFDFGRTLRGMLHRLETGLWLQAGPWREIEHVLVPIDFSSHCRAALETAVRLARSLGAEVRVLHVFEPPFLAYPEEVASQLAWPARSEEAYREQAREALEALVRDIPWGEVPHTHELVKGEPTDEILRREDGFELVVMATRGHTAPLLGHHTYSVLRRAEGAVLALRSAAGTSDH